MKTAIAIIVAAVLVGGCSSRTDFGECIGAFDEKNPALVYKVSAWNVAIGVIFFGLVAPPVYVLVDQTFCPVGKK